MKIKINKTAKIIILIFILFGLFQLSLQLIYIKSNTTCIKFSKTGGTRSTISYHYLYEVESKLYNSHISEFYIKKNIRNLDSLKKFDCVEIEYSVWFPSFSRVIDKRILK